MVVRAVSVLAVVVWAVLVLVRSSPGVASLMRLVVGWSVGGRSGGCPSACGTTRPQLEKRARDGFRGV